MSGPVTTVLLPPQSAAPYAAAFLASYTGAERVRRLYYVDQLLHFTWENPDWSGDQLRLAVNEQLVRYDKVAGEGQLDPLSAAVWTGADWILKAANAYAPKEVGWMLEPAASLAKEVFLVNDGLAAEKRTNAQSNLSDMIDRFGQGAEGQIATAYNTCKTSAACLDALTKGLPEIRLGEDKPPDAMKDDLTSGRVVENNRNIFNQYFTVNLDSGVTVAVDDLHQDVVARLQTLHEQVGGAFTQLLVVLGDVDKDQRDILKWIADQEKQRSAQIAVKAQQDLTNGILDAARADLSAIVAVANLIDPHLGRGIQVIGGAVMAIAEAAVKYTSQVAAIGSAVGAVAAGTLAVATAALAGTVIGAVVAVIALLISSDQPDPDEVLLTQLQHLQQQVGELGESMHQRFDRVDRTLGDMYRSMIGAFNELIILGTRLEGDLTAIQDQLLEQAAQLHRIESAVGGYAVVVGRRDLLDTVSASIGWSGRSDVAMTSQSFLGFVENLRGWATVNAADAAETGALARDLSPGSIASELTDVSLDRNITYLSQCVRTFGAGPLFSNGSTCANPLTWSLAARATAQLLTEQPLLAHHLSFPRSDDVRSTGTHIRECQRSITVDPQGAGRNPFFQGLVDHYTAVLASCGDAVDGAVAAALTEDRLGRGFGAGSPSPNPWGESGQQLDYQPRSLSEIGGNGTMLSPPPGLLDKVANEFLLATWFAGPDDEALRWHYFASWWNVTPPTRGGGNDAVRGGGAARQIDRPEVQKWQMGVAVTLTWQETTIGQWSTAFGPLFSTLGEQPTTTESPDQVVHAEWTQGRNLSSALAQGLSPTDGLALAKQQATSTVNQNLNGLRDRIHPGATNALTETAKVVEGARLVLGNIVALGLPRSLASDDLLRQLLQAEPSDRGAAPVDPPEPGHGNLPVHPPEPPYGNGLVGRAALTAWWNDDHPDISLPPPHFGPQIRALGAQKVQVLRDRLDGYLADPAARAEDTLPLIDDALARLDLADLILNVVEQTGELMPTMLPVLARGANGLDVRRLQGLLLAGRPGPPDNVLILDGDFGPVTDEAVKRFQAAAGLANAQGPSGEVDGTTWRALLGLI